MARVNRIEDGTGAARPCGLTSAPDCADGFMALRPYRAYRGFKEKASRSDVIPAQPAM
jgi:hypothetical protein